MIEGNQKNSPPAKEGSGEVKRINNKGVLKDYRKQLRNNLTPAEARLWTYLKSKQLAGRKFRRQHSIGNYILDFYCPEEKLAIELDGQAHNNTHSAAYDKQRDLFLESCGVKVLRFENKVVFESHEGLLKEIQKHFKHHKLPSCQGGAGGG
jgi:very-short-patch-repair endonuclease